MKKNWNAWENFWIYWLIKKLWTTNPYYRKIIEDLGIKIETSDSDDTVVDEVTKEVEDNDRKD